MGYPSGLAQIPIPIPVALLAPGTEGYQLTVVSGVPAWAAPGEATPFSAITAGTNAAALVVGTGGSLTVSGSGTINATTLLGTAWPTSFAVGDLVYATAANTLSKLADVAVGRVLVSGGVTTAPAYSATPTLGVASTTTGSLTLAHASSAYTTTFQAGVNITASRTYTLPVDFPASSMVLQSTDAGVLSWVAASSFDPTAPGPIGGGTPGSGAFTTLSAVGAAGSTNLTLTQTAAASGTPSAGLIWTGAAHTGLANAEVIDANFNGARTVTFSGGGGAIATQRSFVFQPPVLTSAAAQVFTMPATVAITGAPTFSGAGGATPTATNRAAALHVAAGRTVLGTAAPATTTGELLTIVGNGANNDITMKDAGAANWPQIINFIGSTQGIIKYVGGAFTFSADIGVYNGAPLTVNANTVTVAPQNSNTGSPGTFVVTVPARTGLAATVEAAQINFDMSPTLTWGTGALATQRFALFQAPTVAFVGASTLSDAATVAITAAPIAGTNATITRSHALWVQAGQSTFAGNVCIGLTAPGATAAGGVLALGNGATAPSASADMAQLYSADCAGAGTAALALWAEDAERTAVAVASTNSIPFVYRGTTYYLLCTTVRS